MITDAALAPVLLTAGEGEMIMRGTILKGLSDELIAWVVIESVTSDDSTRITLHAYWHDIFIVSKVVTVIHKGNILKWGVTKS